MDSESDGKTSDGLPSHSADDMAGFDTGYRPLALPILIVGGVIIWCVVLWLVL